ncbi:hypothetical protein CFC21_059468 [Triticum aestivum]|uniref:Uncharacterized protein n=2 Tax=Triticum aestivum TaxID=4565 RepID=A0A3B6IZI5_WHEAT|nr:benzyl alcohol O-benzoyltransferase-like [Triticum aestivum]KAF7051202.1 hypothetical protein CFC21_059468 [Triticum aestivum]
MALSFAVRRRKPELIGPASPTPRETKRLSDIDDQGTLRANIRFFFFYRGEQESGDDPVGAIRRALPEALVHYYPFAGRLREVDGRKLVVDCTGEGVTFVEADADVRFEDLEAAAGPGLTPPFPCMDELAFDADGVSGILGCPLVLIQVTRLLCGGFVVGHRFNHAMCDATGTAMFMNAVAELARGLPAPTVAPTWSRDLLDARSPPAPSLPHREYDVVTPLPPSPPADDMVLRSFLFGPSVVAAMKRSLPPALRDTATSFEVLAAFLWRARTAALALRPDEETRLVTVVNMRRHVALGLPAGYYGYACANPMAVMAAGALLSGSMGEAVELVQAVKASVTAEYARSMADHLVLHGRPVLATPNLFVLTDLRHVGLDRVDFGWGEPVYAGAARSVLWVSSLVTVKNSAGKNVVAVPVALPRLAMERFASEVETLTKKV